jgi:LysM repeat protein
MENPPRLSETQPRTCPNCGASVSSRARTCLICGADLTLPVELVAPPPEVKPVRRFPWQLAALIAGVMVILLAGGALFLRSRIPAAPRPTQTPVPTATETSEPTNTPTPETPTSTPTATLIPTQPNTPVPPTKYTVRAGDTLSTIADRFDTTVEKIQAFNGLENSDELQVGQVLEIPSSGSTPNPTNTPRPTETFVPGPTPGTVLHVVQSGDTLLGISLKYGVSMNLIQTINEIQDPESIRVGQQLVIPIGPAFTPTPRAQATPTGLPTYPAPALLSPPNDQAFEGNDEPILLQWASVGILHQNESYLVRVEQVSGGEPPTSFSTRATGLRLPVEMFPKADDPRRAFQWQVRVVRQTGTHADNSPIYSDASPASPLRLFRWLTAQPTPTPTPGPTQ